MSTTHHTLEQGTKIDCYEIGQVLGVGGFGITYKGYDHTLSCDVAIKEYLPSGVALRTGDGVTVVPKSEQDQDFYTYGLDRFLEEARILAKFHAQSIVRVSRFLEGNGTAYLIMDYEQGQPLNAYLKARGVLSEERILSILAPVLSGLAEVHSKGYLHRDIKPGNIYLREDGSPVLLDFGAARQSMGGHTQAVTSMVTPGYAPIEQYNTTGKQGPWTDFYGLGATLYRCVAGTSPVGAPDRVMALQAGDPDPLVPAVAAGKDRYSEPLLQVIDWMLQPNIADRPQDIQVILARLPKGPGSVEGIGTTSTTVADINTNSELRSSTQWRRDELEEIARELATHIGPMAKVLVKEASVRSHSLEQMYQILAESITSEEGRQTFLREATRRTGAGVTGTSIPATRTGRATGQATAPTATGGLTEDVIDKATNELATYIGPLAKMIVRRAAGSNVTVSQFVDALAQEIDSPADRKKFIQSMK